MGSLVESVVTMDRIEIGHGQGPGSMFFVFSRNFSFPRNVLETNVRRIDRLLDHIPFAAWPGRCDHNSSTQVPNILGSCRFLSRLP